MVNGWWVKFKKLKYIFTWSHIFSRGRQKLELITRLVWQLAGWSKGGGFQLTNFRLSFKQHLGKEIDFPSKAHGRVAGKLNPHELRTHSPGFLTVYNFLHDSGNFGKFGHKRELCTFLSLGAAADRPTRANLQLTTNFITEGGNNGSLILMHSHTQSNKAKYKYWGENFNYHSHPSKPT